RQLSGQIAELLRGDGADLRTRRSPDVWSPLEYACHLRDVLLVQRERLLLALREDRPVYPSMGREERVEHAAYAQQRPEAVAVQLTAAAEMLADLLARFTEEQWLRLAFYRYPEPAERQLSWVAAHTVHEARHHLLDIRRQLP
ncbi:MAG: DinB family protein, partial [Actinocrinis sp.]